MKRRAVIYTTEAGDDLDWIYDTIAGASDPVTAYRYEQRIRMMHGYARVSTDGQSVDAQVMQPTVSGASAPIGPV